MKIEKKETKKIYSLPDSIEFCKKCTISNQRPRITFDQAGVCSACRFSEEKRNFDWQLREKELEDLCRKHKKKDGSYDVIVPCSGGKDGGFVAHQLKYKYGMNPLTVTWAPLVATEIGRKNLDAFTASGLDNILGKPNGVITRKLTQLSFIHLGDPFQPFIYGQTNFPLQIAVSYGISLIMYGENGEVEYGGDMKNAYRPTREITDHSEHYFSGKPPEFWKEHNIKLHELIPFMQPSYEQILKNKTEIHFFSYYKYWDPQENYYYCSENTGFTPNDERSEGTYSKYASLDDKLDGMHYYLGFIKFGIGRCTSDTAHEIRDGKIDREEGVALVKKYDGEFPRKYHDTFLKYCAIDEDLCLEIIDSWRSPHIWQKKQQKWLLKRAVWEE